jgi:hypothetical protein
MLPLILGTDYDGNETSPLNLLYLLPYFLPVPFKFISFALDQRTTSVV